MICKNCNAAVEEGQRFCQSCGADLSAQAPVQPFTPPVESAPQKKKKPVFLLGGVALVLVVAIVITAFNWSPIVNQFKKMTLSDKDYLSYVHQTGQQQLLESTLGAWDAVNASVDLNDCSAETLVSLVPGEAAKDLIPLLMGGTSSALTNLPVLTVNGTVSNKDGKQGGLLTLSANDKALVNVEFVNNEAGELILRIPQINETPVLAGLPGVQGSVFGFADGNTDLLNALPDSNQLSVLIQRYLGLVLAELKDVKMEQGELSLGNVTEKCSVYTAVFDEESYKNASISILKSLKKDKDVERILKDLCAVEALELNYQEVREEFLDGVNEALEEMKDYELSSSREVIEYRSFVNGNGEIIGLEIVLPDGSSFALRNPSSNGNVATELTVSSYYTEILKLKGEGTRKGDRITGDYSLYMNGEQELLSWHLENWDTATAKKGYCNGAVTLKPGASLLSGEYTDGELPATAATLLNSLSLRLEFVSSSVKQTEMKLELQYNQRPLFSVNTSAKIEKAKELPVLENPVRFTDEQAAEAWMQASASKLEALLQSAKDAGLPVELFSGMMGGSAMGPAINDEESWEQEDAGFDSWYDENGSNAWYEEDSSDSWNDENSSDAWYDESTDAEDEWGNLNSGLVADPFDTEVDEWVDINGDGLKNDEAFDAPAASLQGSYGGSFAADGQGAAINGNTTVVVRPDSAVTVMPEEGYLVQYR